MNSLRKNEIEMPKVVWTSNDAAPMYMITITFRKQLNIGLEPSTQYSNTIYYVSNILNNFSEFHIVPEFTIMNRIHYHAIFKIKDKIKYRKNLHKIQKLGMMVIKEVFSYDECIEYIFKDYKENCILLKQNIYFNNEKFHLEKLIHGHTDFNVFDYFGPYII